MDNAARDRIIRVARDAAGSDPEAQTFVKSMEASTTDEELLTHEAELQIYLEPSRLLALPRRPSLEQVEEALRSLAASRNGDDPLARERDRRAIAEELRGLGVAHPLRLVDAAFASFRPPAKESQGQALELEDPEPWREPVDGTRLLDDLVELIALYVVMPEGAAETCALWCVHTYLMDCWEHTPYLAVVSAAKGCGKTTCLTLLQLLSRRGLSADSITASAVFRVVELARPTVILDELDGEDPKSDLWRIINSGDRPKGRAARTVGDNHEVKSFRTYCAKALGYIRSSRCPVKNTVEDRAILITLPRKRRDERRERLRTRSVEALCEPLRQRAMRWALDHAANLGGARPQIPEDIDDRGHDVWEPLVAIAEEAGGRWPTVVKDAALRLSGERREDEAESPGVMLLDDLAELIDEGRLTPDLHGGYASEEMVGLLQGLPGRPWSTWGREGKGLTAHALGRLLKPFGLRPAKLPGGTRRYLPEKVDDVLGRFGTKRQSANEPSEGNPSCSSESIQRYGASEAPKGRLSGEEGTPAGGPTGDPDPAACPRCGRDSCPGDCGGPAS
jgi:hypothetical protein